MKIKEFTLMQKLLFCVNSLVLDRSFNDIAYYLLLHYNEIGELPLKKIMTDCYTSSSTIRRFCQSIGYENFSDLRTAKTRNQEDQCLIAAHNWKQGRYRPRALHDHLSSLTYQIGRTADMNQLRRLARAFVSADCSILFAIRPYALFLEEFQCQMIALGKTVYIFEEIRQYEPLIQKIGPRINNVIVSPTGGIMSALGNDAEKLPGTRSVLICPDYSQQPALAKLLSVYQEVVPLKIKTHDIDYMELYGKYAVSYLFEILFGEILCILNSGDQGI